MKLKHVLLQVCALIVGLSLLSQCNNNAQAQVFFLDNFEQFGNGTDLTATSYTPVSGPPTASVITSVQNGTPTIKATNFLGSIWALFDDSVVLNKNQYKGILSTVQTNQPLQITWKMWIQATNTGPGVFLLSVPVQDANPSITFNPPLAFTDAGSIVGFTNGPNVQTPIGNWGSLAGTVMTNSLILDYPHGTFSYSLNGQILATLPLGPYYTNVVGAIYFNGVERSAGSLGNRFAIDDVTVRLLTATAITTQPLNQIVAATTNLALTVAATNATGFQWLFNGSPITGQTNASFSLGGLRRTNSGSYSVIVNGASGSVTSNPALVRVQVPQRVAPLAQPPGTPFRLAFQDNDGGPLSSNDVPNFEVHFATNFNGLNTLWTTNTSGFTVSNGMVILDDPGSAGSTRRFYRVIER